MLILDTSFLISYYNSKDENHLMALDIMKKIIDGKEEVAITDYIFDELSTILFRRLKNIKKVVEICNKTRELVSFKVDEIIFDKSWEIFGNQEHTHLSFTDASIIAIISEHGLSGVVTFDKDFEKSGVVRVYE